MTPFDIEKEESIEAAFAEAIKAYPPPTDLQEAIKKRLFGQNHDNTLATISQPVSSKPDETQAAGAEVRSRALIKRRIVQYAAGLALVVFLSVALAIWSKFPNLGANLAFADVQEAVHNVETAVEAYNFMEKPWMNFKVLYRKDSDIVRAEWPEVIYLDDLKNGRRLMLNPKKMTAREDTGQKSISGPMAFGNFASPREFLDNLAGIEHKAVKPLGQREFDGQNLVGFAVPRDDKNSDHYHMLLQVWVDPQTRLPARYEVLPEDPNDFAAKFRSRVVTLTYNAPLDKSLFQFSPPENYTLLHGGVDLMYELPPAPQDEKLASPVIEPGIGIGRAKFGMSLRQVIDVLGRPDDAWENWEFSSEESKHFEEIFKKASKEADEKGLKGSDKNQFINEKTKKVMDSFNFLQRGPNGMCLVYMSRGFRLDITNDLGLVSLICFGEDSPYRPFTGKTSKGIGIGSTMQEIEKAYGPPSFKSEMKVDNYKDVGLLYKSLNMQIHLRDGRIWQMDLNKP